MADIQQQSQRLLAACRQGDLPELKQLLGELNIDVTQPKQPWDFDKSIPESQRSPCVNAMLGAAVQGQQTETLRFLFSKFPKCGLGQFTGAAIDSRNLELFKTMLELNPSAANGEIGHTNTLAYACSDSRNADFVKALFEHGADPNKEPIETPPFSNIYYAVANGLPEDTIEQFFNAGYKFDDVQGIKAAVRENRPSVLEIMLTRGADLPSARIPSREELIEEATGDKRDEMVAHINRLYPKKRGVVASLLAKLRS